MATKETTTNEATGVQTSVAAQDPAASGGASSAATSATTQATAPTASRDYVSEIGGNFNLHNATAMFGKDAMRALQAYAQHGGHGVISEDEFNSNLFGGLGAPDSKDKSRIDSINTALSNLGK